MQPAPDHEEAVSGRAGRRRARAETGRAKWQRRIEPVWKPIADGCHLTRTPDQLVEQGGINIDRMETGYLPKSPKFAAYNYTISARVA